MYIIVSSTLYSLYLFYWCQCRRGRVVSYRLDLALLGRLVEARVAVQVVNLGSLDVKLAVVKVHLEAVNVQDASPAKALGKVVTIFVRFVAMDAHSLGTSLNVDRDVVGADILGKKERHFVVERRFTNVVGRVDLGRRSGGHFLGHVSAKNGGMEVEVITNTKQVSRKAAGSKSLDRLGHDRLGDGGRKHRGEGRWKT